MNTENKSTPFSFLRKLAVGLILVGGLAVAAPTSASAGSMPVAVNVAEVDGGFGGGPVMAAVGWGGCGSCTR